MSLFLRLVRTSKWILLAAFVASLVSGFGNAYLITLINRALGASNARLIELGWLFLLVGIVVLIARTLSQTLFMYLGQRSKAELRMHSVQRIGQASYPHLERQGDAKSIAILTQDLDSIVVFFVSLPTLVMQSAVIMGCLIYLGYLSWQILLLAVMTIGVAAIGFRIVHTRALSELRGSRRKEDDLLRYFRALFDGAKELKLHRTRRQAFLNDVLAPNIEAVRVQRTRGYVLYAAAASWGNFILFAFIGVTLFVIVRLFPVDAQVMSGYAIVFLYMIMPIESLLSAIPNIGSARVAFEHIEQVNSELPLEVAGSDTACTTPVESITLKGVTHHYFGEQKNESFTLGPIDVTLHRGEIVFLIGGNGSGKTTLAKILVGLYTPETGQIWVNGKLITEVERDVYRQLFSVVFSDFFLFESLLGMKLEGLDERARQLLEDLQLSHKVNVQDGVFSTLDLSQGQRKRLALLVAYLEDRSVYVFDEWAADQDPVFKRVFYEHLLPALKVRGKMVIVVSHDDQYFTLADRCIKLNYGQIVSAEGKDTGNVPRSAAAQQPAMTRVKAS